MTAKNKQLWSYGFLLENMLHIALLEKLFFYTVNLYVFLSQSAYLTLWLSDCPCICLCLPFSLSLLMFCTCFSHLRNLLSTKATGVCGLTTWRQCYKHSHNHFTAILAVFIFCTSDNGTRVSYTLCTLYCNK